MGRAEKGVLTWLDFKKSPFIERLTKYAEGPFRKLQTVFSEYAYPHRTVLSCPVCVWGAEMGINEKGIAMFARAFMERFHDIPVEDESRINDSGLRERFIESCINHNF